MIKKIKKYPDINKVWIGSDFVGENRLNHVYLETLDELGLLEEVDAYCPMVNGGRVRSRGWRLVK